MKCLEIQGFARDPSTQIIPTLGPKVCRYCLHWAIRIPRVLKSSFKRSLRSHSFSVWHGVWACRWRRWGFGVFKGSTARHVVVSGDGVDKFPKVYNPYYADPAVPRILGNYHEALGFRVPHNAGPFSAVLLGSGFTSKPLARVLFRF